MSTSTDSQAHLPPGASPAQEAEARYRVLLDGVLHGIVFLDAAGTFLSVNVAAGRILGPFLDELGSLGPEDRVGRFFREDGTPMAVEDFPSRVALRTGLPVEERVLGVGTPGQGATLWIALSAVPLFRLGEAVPHQVMVTFSDITERRRLEQTQLFLARAGWLVTGEDFFRALASFLGRHLEVDYVCIDRLVGNGLAALTLAVWFDGHFEDNVEYALRDTPCGDLVGRAVCCFPQGVRHLFPRDKVLQDMGAESYLGVTLWGSTGEPIGLIALIGRRPVANPRLAESTLVLVAQRAAGELERRQAEEARRLSEARLEQAFGASPIGMALVDLEGRFLAVNATLCAMMGRGEAELLAMDYPSLTHPEDLARDAQEVRNLVSGRSKGWQAEKRYLRKDGAVILTQITLGLVRDAQGAPLHCVAQIQDITERRRAEEEQALLQGRLVQAQKMESLGILAGGVAHDMNNVLGAILGLASTNLELHPRESPAFRAFDTIAKAAVRGGSMVRSLLSFARQSPAEERELDLNAILKEDIHLLERTTLSRVRLDLDLDPRLRPIRGDGSALSHALMNLCVNAVEAMAEEGTLAFRTRNLEGDRVELVVEDSGAGMPAEVLERALDPFYTTKPVGKGTGLGLSMVYSTVKAHQGTLKIQSEPGRGTRVSLRFPACGAGAGAERPAEGGRPLPGRVLTVLLVDDDDLIQGSMDLLMEVLGHVLVPVRCGEEALRKLEEGLAPDVVILDMNMPGLGGAGTLPRLRALRPDLPVLLATGRADQTALDLVEGHPKVTLLAKPFSLAELQKHLGAWSGEGAQ